MQIFFFQNDHWLRRAVLLAPPRFSSLPMKLKFEKLLKIGYRFLRWFCRFLAVEVFFSVLRTLIFEVCSAIEIRQVSLKNVGSTPPEMRDGDKRVQRSLSSVKQPLVVVCPISISKGKWRRWWLTLGEWTCYKVSGLKTFFTHELWESSIFKVATFELCHSILSPSKRVRNLCNWQQTD